VSLACRPSASGLGGGVASGLPAAAGPAFLFLGEPFDLAFDRAGDQRLQRLATLRGQGFRVTVQLVVDVHVNDAHIATVRGIG
jgi:hypothetical protein